MKQIVQAQKTSVKTFNQQKNNCFVQQNIIRSHNKDAKIRKEHNIVKYRKNANQKKKDKLKNTFFEYLILKSVELLAIHRFIKINYVSIVDQRDPLINQYLANENKN